MTSRRRIVLAKAGLDGHDVGVRLVARTLMHAGFEVIYLGKRVPSSVVASTAIAEDADAVGLSGLSGGLAHFAMQVRRLLEESDADIPVLAGGIDEPAEVAAMRAAGVAGYLGPGSSNDDVIAAFTAVSEGREWSHAGASDPA